MVRLTSPHAMTSKSSQSRETTASRSWWVLIVRVIDRPASFITGENEPYCLHPRSRPSPVYKQTPSGATLGVRFCHFSLWNPPLSVMTDVTWLVICPWGLTSWQSKSRTAVASRACSSEPVCPPSCAVCLPDLVHVCTATLTSDNVFVSGHMTEDHSCTRHLDILSCEH